MADVTAEFKILGTREDYRSANKMRRQTEEQKGNSVKARRTIDDVVRESRLPGYASSGKGGTKTVLDVIRESREKANAGVSPTELARRGRAERARQAGCGNY